eukprot:4970434-Prorocentrum_lima.AAC.1
MPMPLANGLLRVGCPRMMALTVRWQMRAWIAVRAQVGMPQPWKTVWIQCQGSLSKALLWSA